MLDRTFTWYNFRFGEAGTFCQLHWQVSNIFNEVFLLLGVWHKKMASLICEIGINTDVAMLQAVEIEAMTAL